MHRALRAATQNAEPRWAKRRELCSGLEPLPGVGCSDLFKGSFEAPRALRAPLKTLGVRHRVSHSSESNSSKLEEPCHARTFRKPATPRLSLSERRNSSENGPYQLANGLSLNPRQRRK